MMRPPYPLTRLILSAMIASTLSFSAVARQEEKVAKKDVPAAVIAAFEKAYPKATIRGYAREKEGGKLFYEIESVEGKVTRDILYNPDGSVAEIEEGIATSDLPQSAQEAIRKQYPKATVRKAERITHNSKIGYEVKLKQGKQAIELVFVSSGKMLKSTAK